jgi:BMFP domain-containing protein YqiC
MIDLKFIDELSRKLTESLPPGITQLRDETNEQFRLVLRRAFERMNLVTREEFDTQSAVLARTREKLESLQKQIQELEKS